MIKYTNSELIREYEGELLKIEPCGKDAFRVRATRLSDFEQKLSAIITDNTATLDIIKVDGDEAIVRNGKLTLHIEGKHGKLTFKNGDSILLEERLQAHPLKLFAREFGQKRRGKYKITARFEAFENEKIFGMGQYQQPQLNLKGCTLELAQRNSQVSVPFMISNKGYGFLWNTPSIGEVSFAQNLTKWTSEMSNTLDYVVIAGDTPAEILEKYMELTGKPPMMPDYAMGFWQSKLRYRTRDELMSVAREYHKRKIPLDVIVCDFFHWPHQGDFKFDTDYFPDPKGMVEELNSMGTELMVSIWPTVEQESENYAEMKKRGLLIEDIEEVGPHHNCYFPTKFYDATNPEARRFVWERVKENYYNNGIKIFWLDEAEPEFMKYDFDNHKYYLGDCLEVGNYYPVSYSQGFYEGMQSEGQENIISLVRCAWAGSQRYGALVWSGDIMPTFDSLKCQLSAGLNMAMAGIPWWTTDIGGFDGGNQDSEEYRELMVRWFEYATFCPVQRLHGYREPPLDGIGPKGGGICFSGGDNEIWSYGEDAYEIMRKHIILRNLLKPYTKHIMAQAHENGTPPMRPLFYSYPSDQRAWEIDDEYMYGPDILVCPITELGARRRSVYLPSGELWIDPYTGAKYEGGVTIELDAPIEKIPLLIRKGAYLSLEIFDMLKKL